MHQKGNKIVLYALLVLLALAILGYVAQSRHWQHQQSATSVPASVPQTASLPESPPAKPSMSQPEAMRLARGMCSRIIKTANILTDYVGTGCKPAQAKNGTVDLVIVARKPVFYVRDAKKAWLLVIVGAVGKELTDHGDVPIGDIVVSDPAAAQQNVLWWFPGSLARNVRNQIYAEEITLEEGYLRLLEGMHQARLN